MNFFGQSLNLVTAVLFLEADLFPHPLKQAFI